ncbi:MAG: hypothetical protein WC119_01835 [Synergistaceae bacterium]
MTSYVKRPEPVSISRKETIIERIIEKPVEEKQSALDIQALANAVAQAINISLPKQNNIINVDGTINNIDTFDESKTMGRLAEQMLVQRGESKANFNDLGNVKTTKRDQKDIDNTIDLISQLDN